MTDETWNIQLGDNTFTIPRLPFKVSRVVYPICQRLSNSDLIQRLMTPEAGLQLSDEEMDSLAKITFLAAQASSPDMTQETFDELPITPPQLYDAFFSIRKATGGWRTAPATEDQEPEGEAQVENLEPPQT